MGTTNHPVPRSFILGTTCGPHSAHSCFCGERYMQAFVRPRPQHRGGQAPLAEPPVLMTGFSWSAFRPTLACSKACEKTTRPFCHLRQPMQTYEKPALLRRMQLGMLPLSPLVCAGQQSRSTSRTPTVKDRVRLHSQPWMNLRLRRPQHGLRHRKRRPRRRLFRHQCGSRLRPRPRRTSPATLFVSFWVRRG